MEKKLLVVMFVGISGLSGMEGSSEATLRSSSSLVTPTDKTFAERMRGWFDGTVSDDDGSISNASVVFSDDDERQPYDPHSASCTLFGWEEDDEPVIAQGVSSSTPSADFQQKQSAPQTDLGSKANKKEEDDEPVIAERVSSSTPSADFQQEQSVPQTDLASKTTKKSEAPKRRVGIKDEYTDSEGGSGLLGDGTKAIKKRKMFEELTVQEREERAKKEISEALAYAADQLKSPLQGFKDIAEQIQGYAQLSTLEQLAVIKTARDFLYEVSEASGEIFTALDYLSQNDNAWKQDDIERLKEMNTMLNTQFKTLYDFIHGKEAKKSRIDFYFAPYMQSAHELLIFPIDGMDDVMDNIRDYEKLPSNIQFDIKKRASQLLNEISLHANEIGRIRTWLLAEGIGNLTLEDEVLLQQLADKRSLLNKNRAELEEFLGTVELQKKSGSVDTDAGNLVEDQSLNQSIIEWD